MTAQRADEGAREARATAKYVRLSPYKVRRVADLVRGKPIMEARRLLAFSSLRASTVVSKVLESAVANATNNMSLPEDRLYVHNAFADEGMTWKRWRPRAYGRANRIRKRTSHITVILRAHEQPEEES